MCVCVHRERGGGEWRKSERGERERQREVDRETRVLNREKIWAERERERKGKEGDL